METPFTQGFVLLATMSHFPEDARGGSRTLEREVIINKYALAHEIFRDHAHF